MHTGHSIPKSKNSLDDDTEHCRCADDMANLKPDQPEVIKCDEADYDTAKWETVWKWFGPTKARIKQRSRECV